MCMIGARIFATNTKNYAANAAFHHEVLPPKYKIQYTKYTFRCLLALIHPAVAVADTLVPWRDFGRLALGAGELGGIRVMDTIDCHRGIGLQKSEIRNPKSDVLLCHPGQAKARRNGPKREPGSRITIFKILDIGPAHPTLVRREPDLHLLLGRHIAVVDPGQFAGRIRLDPVA